jgi:hypothetical protein
VSFALYVLGFLIFIGGLTWGAHLMHIPTRWIAVGDIVLIGLAIASAAKNTRQKDPAG